MLDGACYAWERRYKGVQGFSGVDGKKEFTRKTDG
jgi:hypothetical protein